MPKNGELQIVRDEGWAQGFQNLFAKENRRWWNTRQWCVQTLVWLVIVNGMLAMVVWLVPAMQAKYAGEPQKIQVEVTTSEGEPVSKPPVELGMAIFISTLGLAPAIGAIIIGQETILAEKHSGTAAWVLSKPVARSSFILSKLAANGLGLLVTTVLFQGLIAYLQLLLSSGTPIAIFPFLGALALAFLSLAFFLALTVMLGTFFNSRGIVIGIPLVILLGYQLIATVAPWMDEIMPWNLTTSLGPTKPALAMALFEGQPIPSLMPLFATFLWSLLFLAVAVWRFHREEF